MNLIEGATDYPLFQEIVLEGSEQKLTDFLAREDARYKGYETQKSDYDAQLDLLLNSIVSE